MEKQKAYHYTKIAEAITYLDANFKNQPSLDELARSVHMSPYHFQRLFKDWVGISPKKYLQYLSGKYTKALLKEPKARMSDVAYNAGLSGTSRLHDLFIRIEGMTPGTYKNGGVNLNIRYSFADSEFGEILIASTSRGVCFLAFIQNKQEGLAELKAQFPHANYSEGTSTYQDDALVIFKSDWRNLKEIKLHLKGTEFQLKVWEALLKIPLGSLSTYGHIAACVNKPKASRAVGTAIGHNPIAYLIPCHRVIQASGHIGGYRWNPIRKKVMIGWELSKQ